MVKERENFRAKTPSVWLESGRVFFGFLNRIEDRNLPKTLAVLGCSDGNYVLPAAKRGFKVLAIDIDRVALHGGVILLNGREVKVTGLTNRLKTEGVENQVTIVCDNCFPYNQRGTFSRVFTSGSIHYQDNSQYPLSQIINSIQSYVAPGGGYWL